MATEQLHILGYKVANDRLVKLDGNAYEFNVFGSHAQNQRHYEAIGAAMTNLIVERMQRECGLVAARVPVDVSGSEPTSTVYHSQDALTSDKPLLLLVPGISIDVGQWARKIIINESVSKGSMLTYIHRAHEAGYNVLVLNSNQNHVDNVPIRGNETPEEHVDYVWQHLVLPSTTNHVLAVAHSYGGVCMQTLTDTRSDEIKSKKLIAIALTDSVHRTGYPFGGSKKSGISELAHLAVNWIRSESPLGTGDGLDFSGVELRSAGTDQHDQTTVLAIDKVFEFLAERLSVAS
ncbi:Arb2 domain-containing protein [Chytriomyces sp. MP71]|nr:Arb2 domain-containing protein [Chytriomyces sp. MP71]